MKFPVLSSVYKYRQKSECVGRSSRATSTLLLVAIEPIAVRMGTPSAGFVQASTYQSVVVTID
jgi:hypothetical protein